MMQFLIINEMYKNMTFLFMLHFEFTSSFQLAQTCCLLFILAISNSFHLRLVFKGTGRDIDDYILFQCLHLFFRQLNLTGLELWICQGTPTEKTYDGLIKNYCQSIRKIKQRIKLLFVHDKCVKMFNVFFSLEN